MDDLNYDIAVIGGGIVGTTAAYFLARAGMKVALVERGRLAGGTSSKSFAWINGTSKTADENYHRLNARGLAAYCELAVEFGEDALGLNPAGSLNVVRRSDAAGYAAAKERARVLAEFSYPATWVDRKVLGAMEPHVNFPDDAEALSAMADPCLNAPHFVRFMADQVRARGGTVYEDCAAQTLEVRDDGQVTDLVTEKATLHTERVLLAAGPGTPEVLSELTGYDAYAARFPLRKVPGLLLRTPPNSPHRLIHHGAKIAQVVERCEPPAAPGLVPGPVPGLAVARPAASSVVRRATSPRGGRGPFWFLALVFYAQHECCWWSCGGRNAAVLPVRTSSAPIYMGTSTVL